MDPIKLLKQDHDKVRKLFREFESAGEGRRQTIADELMTELEIHTKIEEEIFYPAMRQEGDAQDKERVAHSYEEHGQAKTLIAQLRGMSVGDKQFEEVWRELRKDVEHHADEEERELLPRAEEELRGQMDRLGEEMQARKEELMRQMQTMR